MFLDYEHIVLICGALIALGVLIYVCLDGFDLGVGILFPFAPSDSTRSVMFSSVAPVWDGNATWLIYTGGVLFAAFPLAYSILLPALYIPAMLMVVAFIFRGLAFEFRLKANRSRFVWDIAFAAGSTAAAFLQGAMLGSIIQGFELDGYRYSGGAMDWFSSFAIICGISLVMGYSLLGVSWLIYKTDGKTREWAREMIKPIAWLVAFFILVISINTPLEHEYIIKRWFTMPNFLYLAPVPFLSLLCFYGIIYGTVKHVDKLPYLCTVGLYILSFIGLGISLFPNIVMPSISIWDAAAHENSLDLVFYVLIVSLPIVLGYTIYIYRIFRDKVDEETHHYK